VKTLGGGSIYKKKILDEVGTFNPYMCGEEERELGYRITDHKYKLLTISQPMAYHVDKQISSTEIKEKAKYFRGVGQIIRKYPFGRIAIDLAKYYKRLIIEELILIIFCLTLIILTSLKQYKPLTIIIGTTIILNMIIITTKGFSKTKYYIESRVLILFKFFSGLFMINKNQDEYKNNYKYIKRIK